MARSFDQILAEVNSKSDPQRQAVLKQVADITPQLAADESALGAKKDQAYQDIVDSARRRGLGFSGIPLGEQAKYNATEYAPALANLRTSANNRRTTLEASLADIGANNYSLANQIYGQDRAFEEQQRQFNEQMAFNRQQQADAQRSAAASSNALASLYGGGQQQTPQPSISRKQGGGFAFTDSNGQAISAAKYAQLTNQPLGTVLYSMGQQGDAYAQQLYNQLRNDPFYGKGNAQYDAKIRAQYSPIFWGL